MAATINFWFLLIGCGLSFSFGQMMDKQFSLECHGKIHRFRTIPKRGYVSLGDICGMNLDVNDFDISTLGVAQLTAAATIRCSETETVYATQKGLSATNFLEDLKTLTFDGLPVTTALAPNKQEYCLLNVSLTTTDAVLHSEKMPVLLIPDFQTLETDMAILRDMEPSGVVNVVDGNLNDAVAAYNYRVEYRNLLPLVNDACYYVVAFLRPIGHELPPNNECTELMEGQTEDVFPYLELSDIVVAHKCIMATGTTAETFDMSSVLQEKVTGICGQFELVFLADAVGTIYPENIRCNNYKTMTVNLQCGAEQEPPLCQMTTNIFDLQSVAFMIKGVKIDETGMQEPYRSLYEVEFEPRSVAWVKSLETQDRYFGIKQRGFALIEILWKTIMEQYSDACENVADLKETLRDLEGLDSVDFPDVTVASFIQAYNMKDLDVTELNGRKNGIPADTATTDFSTKMDNAVTMTVLEYLIKEKEASTMSTTDGTNMDMMNYEQPAKEMKVEDMLENITNHGIMMSDEELLRYVKNLTGVLMHLKSKYSTNTCFNGVYDKVISFIQNIKTTPLENLGDFETLYDEKSVADFKKLTGMSSLPVKNASRLEVNSCIKRIDGSIRNKCDMEEDITDKLKKKVCLVNKFQTFIKEKAKSLGISYIMRDLLHERELNGRKNGIPADTATTDFSTKMDNAVTMTVLEYLIKEKEASTMSTTDGTNMDMMNYEQPAKEMKVEDMLENITNHGIMMSDEELLRYVKNLTGVLMHLKSKYSTNTCFNGVYDKVISFIQNIKTTPLENLGDFETLYDEKSVADFKKLTGMSSLPVKNASRLEVNSCIKRIDGSIRNKCDMEEDITDKLKKKVCLVNKFQTFIKEKAKSLGISYIMRDLLHERAMEMDMDISDPLIYRKGGYQIWTYEEGTFYQHVISPTYEKVCKRKMATCHCEVCDNDMGSGYSGDGSSGMSGMGSGYEGTGMGSNGEGMSGMGDGGSGSGSGSGSGQMPGDNYEDKVPLKKKK